MFEIKVKPVVERQTLPDIPKSPQQIVVTSYPKKRNTISSPDLRLLYEGRFIFACNSQKDLDSYLKALRPPRPLSPKRGHQNSQLQQSKARQQKPNGLRKPYHKP